MEMVGQLSLVLQRQIGSIELMNLSKPFSGL